MSSKMRISRADQGAGRKEAPDRQLLIHASAALSDHYSKVTMVPAPKSGHEGAGLSENDPANT